MLFLEAFQHSNIQYSLMAPLTPISSNCIKVQDLHAAQHDSDGRTGAGPSFPENDVFCFFVFWHLKFVLYVMFLVFLCLGWTKELCMRWIDFAHSNVRSSKCNQDCTNQISSVLRLVGTFLIRVKNFWDCLNVSDLLGCPRHFKLQQRTPPGSRLARTLEEDLALTCSQCNLTYKE